MKFGVALPHVGAAASPEAISQVARAAETLGFDSVWVLDRLLWPVRPASKYPGNPRGEMPASMQTTYDPLTVLSFVAAATKKVKLGTSVLVAPYRSPVVVAKMVATLDRLSGGRVIVGLGAGWSADEFDAVGQPFSDRQEQTDEFLRACYALWSSERAQFLGRFYRIPESVFLPRPLQKPHPPVWIGGNTARAIRRAAEFGDGWHPTSRVPAAVLKAEMRNLRAWAEKSGRNANQIELTLRWNAVPDIALPADADKVRQALDAYREAGVGHICFDFNIPQVRPLPAVLRAMETLAGEISR